LIQLSVPRGDTSPVLPTATYARVAQRHFLHLHYFQRSAADTELAGDPAGFLSRVFWALGGSGRYLDVFRQPSEGSSSPASATRSVRSWVTRRSPSVDRAPERGAQLAKEITAQGGTAR
jgi:hypothetical protein